MSGIVPRGGEVCEFGDAGKDHDQGGDTTTESRSRPGHGCGRRLIATAIDARGVESGEEPEDGYVDDPYTVEID